MSGQEFAAAVAAYDAICDRVEQAWAEYSAAPAGFKPILHRRFQELAQARVEAIPAINAAHARRNATLEAQR